jgi:predicted DCC family thiol-disulfide oxidoreductase YuxK
VYTDITDKKIMRPAGGIFFDAECRFCVGSRQRWGLIFERRGFVWLPLQTPGTADRLGITESQLHAEMWLQLADGRNYSGVNAWSVLMRRVWWLWPLGAMLALPGFNAIGRAGYCWIAAHRHCLGGACSIPKRD